MSKVFDPNHFFPMPIDYEKIYEYQLLNSKYKGLYEYLELNSRKKINLQELEKQTGHAAPAMGGKKTKRGASNGIKRPSMPAATYAPLGEP